MCLVVGRPCPTFDVSDERWYEPSEHLRPPGFSLALHARSRAPSPTLELSLGGEDADDARRLVTPGAAQGWATRNEAESGGAFRNIRSRSDWGFGRSPRPRRATQRGAVP